MARSELRKLVIAAIAAVVVPAAVMIGTWAVWHGGPAAHPAHPVSVATSGPEPAPSAQPAESDAGRAATVGAKAGVATGLGASRPQAGRKTPAAAVRLARGQPATVNPPREIRIAAPGEGARAGVIHVAVVHEPILRPVTFEVGPFSPKPDVSVACGTCWGNVLEVNF